MNNYLKIILSLRKIKRSHLRLASFVISICLLFCNSSSWSLERKSLTFPADKNNIQVLPQRFEYSLNENDQIKIGNVLIDLNKFRTSIEKNTSSDGYFIKIRWPANLIPEGEFNLFNNSGKSIWSTTVKKEQYKAVFQTPQTAPDKATDSNAEGRIEIAEYSSQILSSETLEELKISPILKMCAAKSAGNTRVEFCSGELFALSKSGQIFIQPRKQNTIKNANVLINNKPASENGVIYLNDTTENINFKAELSSGAEINIETRMQKVNFMDFTAEKDGKTLLVQASGAEPMAGEKVKKLPQGGWVTSLPLDRPILYLEGEGQIPLKQEFFVKGKLPLETHRISLSENTQQYTYLSSVSLSGPLNSGTKIKNASPGNSIKPGSKQKTFTWTLNNLKVGKWNTAYLQTASQEGSWIGAYEIYRAYANLISINYEYISPWAQSRSQFFIRHYIDHFLFIHSALTNQRWSVGLGYQTSLSQGSTNLKLTQIPFDLSYQFNEGLFLRDSLYGLRVLGRQSQLGDISTSGYGLGLYSLLKTSDGWLKKISDWWLVEINTLSFNSNDLQFKNLIEIFIEDKFFISDQWLISGAIKYENWGTIQSASELKSSQVGINVGLQFIF